MSVRLNIHHLRHFNDELERQVLAPLRGRGDTGDKEALAGIMNFGNTFIERERGNPAYVDAVIWFDVHMGEPAKIGMTWAFNPHAPEDARYGVGGFWRMWSETMPPNEDVMSLEQAQQEFASYTLAHVTK